ncbi:hypothetical protein N7520_003435 [Penicillium odoratum]|uniref:uncharacterized protein n=1 Tax=Penicillium odoratum TaxID=1167516 RepID=UPI002549B479|nr:uncharacterized protein N7520_003435 [Penicillium odoratum]KAJ5768876.1 hypothetical protein N7520_003435 [Penicillium odoratum]
MASIGIVEQISREASSMTTYFFCQNTDYTLNSVEAIIKGLIRQLIRQQKELVDILRLRCNTTRACFRDNLSSWEELWKTFFEMLIHCANHRVYVIVDALDECRTDSMGDFLKVIVRTGLDLTHVKWLFTSRPLDIADQELLNSPDQVGISLELSSGHLESAIKTYISFKVVELYPRHYHQPQELEIIESELLQRAEGTFLWVSLVFKKLENDGSGKRVSLRNVLSTIQVLPSGLRPLYERVFQQVTDGEANMVTACLRLLKVMMLVYRPLNEAEILSVTGPLDLDVVIKRIVDRCASFIKMRGSAIEFAHQSSRDFLTDLPMLRSLELGGHETIMLNCLSYLTGFLKCNVLDLPLPDSQIRTEPQDSESNATDTSVLRGMNYAATLWAEHLEASRYTS